MVVIGIKPEDVDNFCKEGNVKISPAR